LDPEDLDDQARYAEIAQHFDMIGYIWGQSGGFSSVSMSDLGIKYVELEGDLRREEGLE
jgi:hypothetical protein